ncbi:MAG: hypothetical protein ISR65_11955 [Bacteriovoracaceae bacterium]|nr:hypothetical protein [Bacteriovoracaceae bacterium]
MITRSLTIMLAVLLQFYISSGMALTLDGKFAIYESMQSSNKSRQQFSLPTTYQHTKLIVRTKEGHIQIKYGKDRNSVFDINLNFSPIA